MTPRVLLAGMPPETADWLKVRLEGAVLHATRTGNETIDVLGRGHWALLVLDHGLADPSAVAVLSWARTGLRLTRLPVFYCLPASVAADLPDRLVRQMGVVAVLSHPVEREELAQQVAAALGLTLAPRPEAAARRPQASLTAARQLWELLRDAALGRLVKLERTTLALLDGTLSDEVRAGAMQEAENLAGSVRPFGLTTAAELAGEMQQLLGSHLTLDQGAAIRMSELVLELRRELEEAIFEAAEESTGADGRPWLLILEDDAAFAERLAAESRECGFHPQVVRDSHAAEVAVEERRPHALLLDLSNPQDLDGRLGLLQRCTSQVPPVPVVVTAEATAAADRVEVALLGGSAFLQKPLPPVEVVATVSQVLQRQRHRGPTVLVVDRRDGVALMDQILKPRGIRVEGLDDPLKFWRALEDVDPDLVVLALDLPSMGVLELCRGLKGHARWSRVPRLVVLPNEATPEDIRRAFAAGCDDIVVHPVVGPEAAARVIGRLERAQLMRNLEEVDPVTGVANRAKAATALQQLLRLAARQNQPFSLAVLQVSNLWEIVDRGGHDLGDEVLRAVSDVLVKSFRGEDVVSRWGADEFVLGMYGMRRGDGVQRLIHIINKLHLAILDGGYNAAVAQHAADGRTLNALYQAVHDGLLQARALGPNRVVAAGMD